jgi:hypothetical protein
VSVTRLRDTTSCREASLSVARLALVVPGGLVFWHLFGAALVAGDELGRTLPPWARVAIAVAVVALIVLAERRMARGEVARG